MPEAILNSNQFSNNKIGESWPRDTALVWQVGGVGFEMNSLGGNNLCSPSPLEEIVNRGPNTPRHMH